MMKTSISDKKQAPMVGCYSSVSKGKYDFQEVELPLKSFSYDVELTESLAYLKLQQVYVNDTKNTLDVQYIFPINPKAVVDSFEMTFGGKTVKGIVKSQQDAKKQFAQNQEENRKVGMGCFQNYNSRGILQVRIGNIYSKQEVKIKLAYIHPVSLVLNTFYLFRLPTTITPRYVSRLDSHKVVFGQNQRFDRSIEGCCSWSLNLRVKSHKALTHFFSKTHQIQPVPKKIAENMWEIQLNQPNLTPNKDFDLHYTFDNFQKPTVLLSQVDNYSEAAISFVPRFFNLQVEDAKKKALAGEQESCSMSLIKGQYIFILDRSLSMAGTRIKKAKEALIVFLKSLPKQSYFNIISFGDSHELLYTQSQKYQQDIVESSINAVKEMTANLGGTQILPPLKESLTPPPIEGHPRHVFLLTDGAIFNTASVIAYAAQHTKTSRVHTIGVGDGCSEDLILGCAQMGKGHSVFIADSEDPAIKIIELLDKSLSPVISNLTLEYDNSKIDSVVPNPKKNPYILKNEISHFYFGFKGKLSESFPVVVQYTDSLGRNYRETIQIHPKTALYCPYVTKMVNSVRLNALYSAFKYEEAQEDHLYYVKQINKQELAKQITEMSVKYQVLSDLTAFICVDESIADQVLKSKQKQGKESVNILPMNPSDHRRQWVVSLGGVDQQDGQSQAFVDECAIQFYSGSPLIQTKIIPIPKKKPHPMIILERGQETMRFSSKIATGQKLCIDLISVQGIDGSWSNQEWLKQIEQPQTLRLINKIYHSKVTDEVLCTFVIMKYIERYSDSKKVLLILRKARQFIDSQPQGLRYEQLNSIWKSNVMKA